MTRIALSAVVIAAIAVVGALPFAAAQDPQNRRLIVRNGQLFRGTSPVALRAIETPKLFAPGVTDEEIVRGFIDVSKVGGTGVWFTLGGLSDDGKSIDKDHVSTLRKVKGESMYRYIAPVCRVFGPGPPKGDEARLNAIREIAATFADDYGMIYWIDGPNAEQLTAEFKRLAPKLTVLSEAGGDLALIQDVSEARTGRPAVVIGKFTDLESPIHCLLPAREESFEALAAAYEGVLQPAKCAPSSEGLSPEERAEGFVSLFDGDDLDCWFVTGSNPEGWAVRDGVIEWLERGGGVVLSRRQYGDFVLRLEWKLFNEGANSGLFLRAPIANRMSKMGFEFQLFGDHGKPTDEHSTGSIYSVHPPLKSAAKPAGEWNQLEIRLEGAKYTATLNGELVQDVNFDELPEMKHRLRHGHIGLQDHSNKVMFRNIRIKELN